MSVKGEEANAKAATKLSQKYRRSNCFSRLIFWWVNPLLSSSGRKALENGDLFHVPQSSEAAKLVSSFDLAVIWDQRAWPLEKRPPTALEGNFYMRRLVNRVFGRRLLRTGVLLFLQNLFQLAVPVLMQLYLQWFTDTGAPTWKGWTYASGCTLCIVLGNVIFSNHTNMQSYMLGMDLRTLFTALVYRKSLRLSQNARANMSTEEILSLVSYDCERLPSTMVGIHSMWISPIFIIAAMTLLIMTVKLAAIVGIAVLLLTLPLPVKIGLSQMKVMVAKTGLSARRAKLVREGLSSLRMLKYHAWEAIYEGMITDVRTSEIGLIRQMSKLQGYMMAAMMATPLLITYIMTTALFFFDAHSFTPANVFTSLTLLNFIRMHLGMLPMGMRGRSDLRASLARLQSFLRAEQREAGASAKEQAEDTGDNTNGRIYIVSASFRWATVKPPETSPQNSPRTHKVKSKAVGKPNPEEKPKEKRKIELTSDRGVDEQELIMRRLGKTVNKTSLSDATSASNPGLSPKEKPDAVSAYKEQQPSSFGLNLNGLEVQAGQILAIVGPEGSGKSSCLNALFQEMPQVAGHVNIEGSVAYCSQTPWIFSASLRDNILFNQPMEEKRYNEVLEMCGLTRDCAGLPDGDLTEVGKNGFSLSMGQEVRISLARACYSRASIYMLDDVLSSLDRPTGNRIFHKCILTLSKQGKLIVMATSQMHLLPKADLVCVLESKSILTSGIAEIRRSNELMTSKAILQLCNQARELRKIKTLELESTPNPLSPKSPPNLSPRSSPGTPQKNGVVKELDDILGATCNERHLKLERSVSCRTWHYLLVTCAGGWCKLLATACFLVLSQTLKNVSDWWLSWWAERAMKEDTGYPWWLRYCIERIEEVTGKDAGYPDLDLVVYGSLGITAIISVYCRSSIMARLIFQSGRSMHDRLLMAAFRSRISCLDALPLPTLASCFNEGVESLDVYMQHCLPQFLILLAEVVGLYLTIGISIHVKVDFLDFLGVPKGVTVPLSFSALVPLGVAYWLVQRRFRPVARQLLCLESTSRSTIFLHFAEALKGASTIRAFRQSQHAVENFMHCIDSANRTFFTTQCANRWLQIRLEFLDVLLFTAVACFGILGRSQGSMSVGVAGLTMFYAQSCSQCSLMIFTVRMTTEAHMRAAAAEHIHTFIRAAEHEAPFVARDPRPEDWLVSGSISFVNVSVKYKAADALALKGVTFTVDSGRKMGICGRRGSGKSTILNALFRMNDSCGGTIILDDVNIGTLGLHALRNALTIVPQEAVMFAGTVKDNLDLSGQRTEEELWHIVKVTSLAHVVRELPEGLAAQVPDGGASFSHGQRTLVCLARALLRKALIVCYDEAPEASEFYPGTGSFVSDIIRSTLRSECSGCTVLICTQCPSTIAHCDSIAVLEDGALVECDTPLNLLDNSPVGKFRSLVYDMSDEAVSQLEADIRGIVPVLLTEPADAGVVSL